MRVNSNFDSISGAAVSCAVAVADGQQRSFARDSMPYCVSYRAFGTHSALYFPCIKKACEITEHD
jgi:hypothetical protein